MASAGTVRWVAHAGLGIARPGGGPSVQTLAEAVRLGVDRVELDVCATADRSLVLRHDTRGADGQAVEHCTLGRLRRDEPWLLTLDDALDHLAGLPVLLDVKTVATAPLLGAWLRTRRDRSRFAVCTETLVALLVLRDVAPGVERWRSFPDVGSRRPEHVARVLAALLRHVRPAHLGYLARELSSAAVDFRSHQGRARAGGVPWRRLLPRHLDHLAAEAGAAAICVHHFLVTPQLVERAAALRLPSVSRPAPALAHL